MARPLDQLKASRDESAAGFVVLGALVAVMWIVEIINALDGQQLDGDGIISRHLSGLAGILSAPFLHASFAHLISNTIPFVILGIVIALGGAGQLIGVTVIVALISGLGAWGLSSSGTDTIGASGVVFGYATFLMARGIFTRSVLQIVVGVVVAVLFGAALLLSLVPHTGVSWQDHLFGAIGGVLAARGISSRRSGEASPAP
ncbi:MAG: rhomboid family intramembrane serine protease [Solirubrobacteraceae bacterium]|jgi:membrane associated rhomboid family serine protease